MSLYIPYVKLSFKKILHSVSKPDPPQVISEVHGRVVHACVTQDKEKKLLSSPASPENCHEFLACDSSALGGSFSTSKTSIVGNFKAFLITIAFSCLNRALSFFEGICQEVQIEKVHG